MILPDTSVWVAHLRYGHPSLAKLLVEGDEILTHPFVIGELACGQWPSRRSTLERLRRLREAPMMQHDEVLALIERHRLMGSGLGWLDAHLLGSALLAGAALWTLDAPLARAATKLSVLIRP
ncbi:MAG: PIN domain-containing protein [Acidobacteria bacterium]|nr:PIN domain-containing protein [Acidobacteriota bacterium]